MTEILIRAMRPADLRAVFALQCRVYSAGYHEPIAALASQLHFGADFCWIAERGGAVLAYVLAHPWAGEPPALHAPLLAAQPRAEYLFLHDLAVCPSCRGVGVAKRLIAALQVGVQGRYSHMRLVAVGQAYTFWQGLGFARCTDAELHPAYGEAALMQHEVVALAPP